MGGSPPKFRVAVVEQKKKIEGEERRGQRFHSQVRRNLWKRAGTYLHLFASELPLAGRAVRRGFFFFVLQLSSSRENRPLAHLPRSCP